MQSPDSALTKILLQSEGESSAEIYLHGAHLASWRSSSGEELIFVSSQAIFKPPKAIRGGIPVCFPQFSDFGPLSQHGFARNSQFEVHSRTADAVTLILRSSEATLKLWPHDFELLMTVTLGKDLLRQELLVKNTGLSPLEFTTALHTYFRVSDITKVHVDGLTNAHYLDNLDKRVRKLEEADTVQFLAEVDRIYAGSNGTIQVVDDGAEHAIAIRRDNFPDAVVWNPWVEKAKATADFGDAEYQVMVCVEPAVAASGPIKLDAGEVWRGVQTLRLQDKAML